MVNGKKVLDIQMRSRKVEDFRKTPFHDPACNPYWNFIDRISVDMAGKNPVSTKHRMGALCRKP
jgi:hypothetical protein